MTPGLFITLVLALWVRAPQENPPLVTIEGSLSRLDTQEAIAGAMVTAARDGTILRTRTRADGTFTFQVPPGRYEFVASADGYRPAKAGVGTRTIDATNGINPPGFSLALTPPSILRGTVTSRSGSPLSGMPVELLTAGYSWGRRTVSVVASARTDPSGNYQLGDLDPGSYFLRVEAEHRAAHRGATYFPGTDDVRLAQVTTLLPGATVSLAPFDAVLLPKVSISGKIVNVPPDISPASFELFLIPVYSESFDEAPAVIRNAAESRDLETGAFTVEDVVPGTYNLFAVRLNATSPECLVGGLPLEVTRDVTELTVPVHPCTTLEVQAHLWGYALPDFTGEARVILEPAMNFPTSLHSLTASQSPLSVFAGVSELNQRPVNRPELFRPQRGRAYYDPISVGAYRIVSGSLPHSYVRDIRQGDVSLLQTGLLIANPKVTPIDILFSLDGESVSGQVVGSNGRAVANTTVVLVPDAPYRNTIVWYRAQITDSDGEFSIRSNAPWTYRLFAWEGDTNALSEQSPYLNAEFLRQYEMRGVSIDLRNTSQELISVPLIEAVIK